MIESCYWKEDILALAMALRRNRAPLRWTERQAVLFEKKLITGFFWVRMLMDAHKISSRTRRHRMLVYRSPRTSRPINLINLHDVDDLYLLGEETAERRPIAFIANQLIHSHIVYPYRSEGGPWDGIITTSDNERDRALYRVPLAEIVAAFELVGTDYPTSFRRHFDSKGRIVTETD